jgi:hypothetical protein
MNAVIGLGISLIFMVIVTGLVKSLIMDCFEPEKATPGLLPQTAKTTVSQEQHRRLRWYVIHRPSGQTALLIYQRGSEWEIFSFQTMQYTPVPARSEHLHSDIAAFLEQRGYSGEQYQIVTEPPEPRLPATGSNEKSELEELVIALRDAPSVEDQIFLKLTAPRKVMEQYRKLSPKQIREIEQHYPRRKESAHYQADSVSIQPPVMPADLAWLLADNRPLRGLDLLPTTEAAESKVEGILKQLRAGVESIQQSDQFRLFLSTMAKFHDYSIGNLILIMLQKPNATHVAGFNTWKELGRWVKSGEKGIAILAPVFPPAATCEKCGARLPRSARFCPKCGAETNQGEELAATPRYFRIVHVFDLSQTEGRPIPEFSVPALSGEANEELYQKTLALANQQGLTVSFESKPEQDPEIKGFYSGKLIWVRPEESRAQQLKTLLHEMAHYYTEGVLGLPRKDAETIAESVAFAVGAHFGFDTGVRSFPYVALWSQDKKVLEENLGAIRKVTAEMIQSLET